MDVPVVGATGWIESKRNAGRSLGSPSSRGGPWRPHTPTLPANVAYDLSLQHPRCVFQLLKQQYSRYTPEMVLAHYRHSEGPVPHYIKRIMPTASKPSEWESFNDWSNSSRSWFTTNSM
jgi:hypothetical protein